MDFCAFISHVVLGLQALKFANLDLGSVRPKFSTLQALHGLRTQKIVQFDGLLLSIRSKKTRIECLSSNSEADREFIWQWLRLHYVLFANLLKGHGAYELIYNGDRWHSERKLEEAFKCIWNYLLLQPLLFLFLILVFISIAKASTNLEDNSEKTVSPDALSTLIPNSFEFLFTYLVAELKPKVESLLTVLCDTTSIAEFELKLSGFRLHVTRNLAEQSVPPEAPYIAPVTAHSVAETPHYNDSATSPSLALTKPVPSSGGLQPLLDKAADQGLKILQSPRVGYFRRSRTIKGKRAPPSCKEKDIVKEGQVLCYIEQLGGESPVESDVSGEVVKILREDGDPVGYGDALIAILPSFPGIMKLK
ncbi:UNVERIFIED_CONTAM: Biotin carboxyl carrier protein of acetyl-CoA carboxylase [Sesamum radiatum]|uniref:Biotin carboxyl carrier protein of acetyl-CoA carboxylase n=1 Tax=Sesamum radiatum TaxID=300843 RepID=A0AAW2VKR6_SESRA